MNSSAILFGVLPLIVFAIVDSFSSLKYALVSATLLAFLEMGFSFYYIGKLDIVTGFSVFLIIVLAATAYTNKKGIYLKMQPTVFSAILGLAMIILYFAGHPILYEMMHKYQSALPGQYTMMMQNPAMIEITKLSSHYCGYSLLLHAAANAWAALKLNNFWWIAIRISTFYFFLFIGMIAAGIHVRMTMF